MRYSKPTNVQDVLENSSLGKIMQKGILLQQLNEQLERLFLASLKGFIGLPISLKIALLLKLPMQWYDKGYYSNNKNY